MKIIFIALIIKDQQPFSIVENEGFKASIAGGYQFYKLYIRKYYTNLLNAAYEGDRSLLMENLKMIKYCGLLEQLIHILLNVVKRCKQARIQLIFFLD